LDPQELRLLIARLTNLDARYIFVERDGRDGRDVCCVIYRIRINYERSEGRNIENDSAAVAAAINSSPDFSAEPATTGDLSTGEVLEENSASSVVLSGIVALLSILLAM